MNASYSIDTKNGLIAPARQVASPNATNGRQSAAGHASGAWHQPAAWRVWWPGNRTALFTNQLDWDAHPYFDEIRGLKVSAHLLIRRDGELIAVRAFYRACLACRRVLFRGATRCNDFSIGIELEGEDETPYENRAICGTRDVLRAIYRGLSGMSAGKSLATAISRRDVKPIQALLSTGCACMMASAMEERRRTNRLTQTERTYDESDCPAHRTGCRTAGDTVFSLAPMRWLDRIIDAGFRLASRLPPGRR